jgi:hypothetical protein
MHIHRIAPALLSLLVVLTVQAQRPNPGGDRLTVPVVVHAGGIASEFRSDVFLFNRGETDADLSLTFTPSGADGTSQFMTVRRFLPPGNLVAYEDIVASLFETTGSGALEISGDVESIVARSTTYNVTSRGKVAQSVVVVSNEDAIGIDESPLFLMPISKEDQTRTNVGISETAGKSGVVKIRIGAGLFPGESIEIPILPFSHRQVPLTIGNRFFSRSASVEVISGEARVAAYASIIENLSGDPMYVAARRSPASRQVIPVAAHFSGPEWASEIWYAHLQSAPDIIFPPQLQLPFPQDPPAPELTFYPSNDPGAPRTYRGPGGNISSYYASSALALLFQRFAASGQIQYTPPSGGFITTRLWTPAGPSIFEHGTVGQLIEPVPVAEAIGDGESVDAIGTSMSPDRRTNIGITEVTGAPARVRVTFHFPDGTEIGAKELDLAGYGNVQFSITQLAIGFVPTGRVRFTVVGGAGRVLGYASVVENATGDPTFILAE